MNWTINFNNKQNLDNKPSKEVRHQSFSFQQLFSHSVLLHFKFYCQLYEKHKVGRQTIIQRGERTGHCRVEGAPQTKHMVFVRLSFEMTLPICIACRRVFPPDDWDDSVQCALIAPRSPPPYSPQRERGQKHHRCRKSKRLRISWWLRNNFSALTEGYFRVPSPHWGIWFSATEAQGTHLQRIPA